MTSTMPKAFAPDSAHAAAAGYTNSKRAISLVMDMRVKDPHRENDF